MNKTIYFNGNIITMENELHAESVVSENGIIKKVGNLSDINKDYINNNTEFFDLKGMTLMPSFIDSHSHITAFANTFGMVNLEAAKDFDNIIKKIKEFKKNNNVKNGEWIFGFGYDNNNLKEKSNPTRNILDLAAKENPIIISHVSGHMGVLNTLALKIMNINANTPNIENGIIGREKRTNIPNGYLEESAFTSISSRIPQQSIEKILNQFELAQDVYLKNGITTCQDGFTKSSQFLLLKSLAEKNKLKLDVVSYIDFEERNKILNDNKKYLKLYNNNLKIGGYKIFLDGSPQGKTAWISYPYENSGKYCGYPIHNNNDVNNFIQAAIDDNVQIIAHCNGDCAAEQLINCFEVSNIKNNVRPVMIHAQLVRDDQLERMKKLNMTASFFVSHVFYWGDVHIKNLGIERASKISPVNTAIKEKVNYTFHQDTPVIYPNMLETVWCAVNRITKNNFVLGKDEKISTIDALKAITINSAYQYFEENTKGSISTGKNADFVILDRNPLKTPVNELNNINVIKTIKSNNVLFSAN